MSNIYKNNKNKIKGNTINILDFHAEIVINSRKYGTKLCLIDLCDVEACKLITWHVDYSKDMNSFYTKGYVLNKNGKRNKKILIHRYLLNPSNEFVIDHINHNTLDNRRNNLQIVNTTQNKQNLLKCQYNNKSSGIKNVYWDKEYLKWRVALRINRVLKSFGRYNSIEDAERVAIDARRKYFSNSQENLNV